AAGQRRCVEGGLEGGNEGVDGRRPGGDGHGDLDERAVVDLDSKDRIDRLSERPAGQNPRRRGVRAGAGGLDVEQAVGQVRTEPGVVGERAEVLADEGDAAAGVEAGRDRLDAAAEPVEQGDDVQRREVAEVGENLPGGGDRLDLYRRRVG